MQTVCNVDGRFLDISIGYEGATSDIVAFERSNLYQCLKEGLLVPDLSIFGDNAYLNCLYMVILTDQFLQDPKMVLIFITVNYKYISNVL